MSMISCTAFYVVCDWCQTPGAIAETERAAENKAVRLGWRIFSDGHYCPRCYKEGRWREKEEKSHA